MKTILLAMKTILLAAALLLPQHPAAPDPVLTRALHDWPQGRIATVGHPGQWGYEQGVFLDGVLAHYLLTRNPALLAYVQSAVDRNLSSSGQPLFNGQPYPLSAHALDDLQMGHAVLTLFALTHNPRYAAAATFLHAQLETQPVNSFGGYWHKQIYPNQMWLDGAYMAEPFETLYAITLLAAPNHEAERTRTLTRVVTQLLLMYDHMRDPRTGLLRHGWDPTRTQPWADPVTGLSPQAWARADGWYAMALVDVLDLLPPTFPRRALLARDLQSLMAAVLRAQDPHTHLWPQVLDAENHTPPNLSAPPDPVAARTPANAPNFPEASASCMFTYALAKGARIGILPAADRILARTALTAIRHRFVRTDGTFTGTVRVGGLGGNPYRSGSYRYYLGETVIDNDPKGIGAYLLATAELAQP